MRSEDKGRTQYFFWLGQWKNCYPSDFFEYFTVEEYGNFCPSMQEKAKNEKIFSDEEFKILKEIYNKAIIYYKKNCASLCGDNNKLDDVEALEIEKLIITFLNLPSMKVDFEILKKFGYYSGFAG